MEQAKSNTVSIFHVFIITAIVVGGGVYMWQKSQIVQPTVQKVIEPYNGGSGPSDPAPILPKTCVDERGGTPVITSLSVSSGSTETIFEIKGCNFVSLDGMFNAWIENNQGVKGALDVEKGYAKSLIVRLRSPLCVREWAIEGGSGCDNSFILTPGAYKVGVTYVGKKIGDTYQTKKSNEVSLTINPTYTLESYENKTLNIAFFYPQDWGNISQEKNGTDHITLSAFQAPTVFLAADNGGKSVPRGAYWGDSAGLIDSQSYIDNLCGTKNKAQKCEIKINSAGVKYAKVVEEVMDIGGSTIETNYYIYNSNSEFRGIIISTDRLKAKNTEALEEKLQNLVDSFHFTD